MNFSEMNDEHKVQINLSSSAWQIIEHDINLFYTETISNISGPMNHNFNNYYEKSSLNISETIEKELQGLRNLLKAGNLSEEAETAFVKN